MRKKLNNLNPKSFWKKFKTLSFKKKLLTIGVLAILLIVVFQVIANATKKPGYTLTRVSRSNITEVVTETGNISSNGIKVYSPTNGVIEEVYVANGAHVSAGDKLFKVKSSATEQEKDTAYANYMTAVSALGTAQATMNSLQADMFNQWDKYKTLAESGKYENDDNSPKIDQRTLPEFNISQKTWLAAEAAYKNQQNVVSQAQAQTSSTWLLYQATQDADVKATGEGTVSNLSVSPGSTVFVNLPASPVLPVLAISNDAATEIMVPLSETDIAKIKEGQRADIKIKAASDKTYKGTVTRADRIGNQTQGVIRYNVYIAIQNPDDILRQGMTADATILTKEVKNTLSLPNSSIKPYQGGKAIRVLKNGKITYIPVKVGIKGTSRTEILDGVTEGQEVINTLSSEQLKKPGIF
ncbi:MAG: efflux RND transporter periplasmic adaptor subunit [Candidatus Levyibacteriota bacterium]